MHILFATILPSPAVRKTRLWLSVVVPFLLLGVFAFRHLGYWLDREDPLQRATAIAVLSGRIPERALEAARLYNQGYAPQVWLTYTVEPGLSLQRYGVPYAGDETYNRLVLQRQGVPESAIRILDPPIVNTADEMQTIGQALAKEPDRRVIIVTSRVHTRRSAALWKLLSSRDGSAIVRGVTDDAFDPGHWWRNTTNALDVVREVLGLFNVWAGLPLRPARL